VKINWHSASESSGWATPGAANSVFVEAPVSDDKVVFSSTKITPDNDGNDDILLIQFNLTGNGNVVSVSIFDETGSYIKKVAANLFTGHEASIIWDGTADDGSIVNNGIYIVFITLFDDTGKTERWTKVCTVIRN
jgi:flagellar hook assembly protein FlgD